MLVASPPPSPKEQHVKSASNVKILTIVGARPQFIKAAPVSRALAEAGLVELLLHTGQHYDGNMSDVFFRELGLRSPDIHLGVGSGSHATQTGAMLVGIEKAVLEREPDLVLIYGDTNSTLAGALAASKLGVPVAHVEAGLRSFNRSMPEEINRLVADQLSTLLFVPTETALRNLRREGCGPEGVYLVGDVMRDAIDLFAEKARSAPGILEDLQLTQKSYILATIHRAENTDRPATLRAIFEGLGLAAREIPVIVPLHPRTRQALQRLGAPPPPGVRLIDPVGFLDMQRLEMGARVIATDSGGVQKEAFWHKVPCVTLRNETEWVELIQAGVNCLCRADDPALIAQTLLAAKPRPYLAPEMYGDGTAARKIAAQLLARQSIH
jgi:UDP-GlcNAc3NAcA epimerase